MPRLEPATRPTLYFIGVTTAQSSIMRIFPAWAEALGLRDAAIRGIDCPLRAEPAAYRSAVEFIKSDPLSRGALITTHKVGLFAACRGLFDRIDPLAELMRETSCLSKRAGLFVAQAKDPITCGLALDGFFGPGHLARTNAEVFCMGAGGSGVAIAWFLTRPERGSDLPARLVVSDRSRARLEELARVLSEAGHDCPLACVHVTEPAANDAVLAGLRHGSLIVNATGLGKDAPGSPLTRAARFPQDGVVWELNYRGNLVFLEQARAQAVEQNLQVFDGWTYFLHGWTRIIAAVFEIDIPTAGPDFERLSEIALAATRG